LRQVIEQDILKLPQILEQAKSAKEQEAAPPPPPQPEQLSMF
jgi:hypothetical protein